MDAPPTDVSKILQSILRHDKKLNTFKIALIRSLNDTALNFAALQGRGHGIAVPIRVLAEWWIGYYWPFMDIERPIMQGPRAERDGILRQDVAFRESLTNLKLAWKETTFGSDRAADGMVLVSEMKTRGYTTNYDPDLVWKYDRAIKIVARCVEQPITYSGAGNGQHAVFSRQQRLRDLPPEVVALPGSNVDELCTVIPDDMWEGFKYYSIFIDALCIHEWSLFTEGATQEAQSINRGSIYHLLTDRPDSRRPLTWERNRIDLLLMEGQQLRCVWTSKILGLGGYDLDHIIPVSTYPINELWNLVPSESNFNKHMKRALMPSDDWKNILPLRLLHSYEFYQGNASLKEALQLSSKFRFTSSRMSNLSVLAQTVSNMVFSVANSKNTPRFKLPK